MHPSDLADFFERLALLLEIRGREEDSFPIIAYKRAVETFADHEGDIERLLKEGKLHTLPGIGKRIEDKVEELIKTGKVREYEELKKEVPESLLDLLKIPSLGPKKASVLFHQMQIKDLTGFKKALEKKGNQMADLPRFGKRTVEKFGEGLKLIEKMSGRTLIGEAIPIVEGLLAHLQKCKDIKTVEVAGSYRRREESIGDIDFLVTGKNREAIGKHVVSHPEVEQVLGQGDTKVSILLKSGLQVDVRMIESKCYGAALQYFTGGKAHNVELRAYAKNKGFKISEYGIFNVSKGKEEFVGGKTEEELYQALGMDLVPPELRQGSGEIEAALNHELPKLVERRDIKGALHCHSTWSDGHASIEAMAKAAEKLGFEYIAISDHSPSLGIAGGKLKTKADVLRKKKEIAAVQKKVAIKILCGTEMEIKGDESVDYSDDILKEFDVVIAAIHSGFEKDNTERLLGAINHPLVHAIAHPSGRHLGSRKAYPFDEEKVFKAAAKTGTWLEINGQPTRLDLPYGMCRKAKEHGVTFIVSTDAHSESDLGWMDLGVSVARRGWIEKGDIANTLPLKKFLAARKNG